MTVERFREVTEPGDRKHLVDGRIVVNESSFAHSLLQGRLFAALSAWSSEAPGRGVALFPTDVAIDAHNSFGPDVLWYGDANYRPPPGETYADRIPDLCVEVRSPDTWRYDIGAKKAAYERGGLPELWLVDDQAKAVLVFRRMAPGLESFDVALEIGRGDELESPMLPEFGLAINDLFAE